VLRLHFSLRVVVGFAVLTSLASCSSGGSSTQASSSGSPPSSQASVYDPSAVPSGPLGEEIRLGRDAIMNTQKLFPHNVGAAVDCASCHIAGGTQPRGGSLVGTYARFPAWSKRAKRVITLQDRLAECFLYSENGTPPSYTSKEMIGMVAYIAYLSRNVPIGTAPEESKTQSFIVPLPKAPPNLRRGATLYAQKCTMCHQADGAGVAGEFPPLWGPKSFNNGAGMAHINRMTGFVMYNMPKNAPGSLTLVDAYDISGYVLSHERPRFKKSRTIAFPSEPAAFF
jgi:thiosulfate dehydrogenase